MQVFEMNQDTALLFFTVCKELNLNTIEEREAALNVMAKEGYFKRSWTTERTKEEFIKDLAKHYKILHVKSKETETDPK